MVGLLVGQMLGLLLGQADGIEEDGFNDGT